MAGSVNKHILIGHLGKDPVSRPLQSGGKVVTFSLATSETWKDKVTGERREQVAWHNIVIFNEPVGEIAMKYLKKGSSVYLEGQSLTRTYEKAGETRYVTETVIKPFAGVLTLLDKAERAPGPTADAYAAGTPAPLDDEIPF